MKDVSQADPVARDAAGVIDVVLEGGPADLPADLRSRRVSTAEKKIKILYYGGYEHFERGNAAAAVEPVVFRWTGRTRIAE
ncbi:DUF5988 family protein [Micromonospora aurantiaca]|uniref:DUF5988 family protein n=1 Tax=Micromonospora TaxID=1873 RepID=UPI0001C46EBE|nr:MULTISPECIES: DUF5988 family protein [Micromonospora]ADU11335.1 hypothetical protein ML5_5878 [Micromonospora sp. L5]MBC9001712.1 hypothetical protein [Micromonospora aurantiaca]OHX02884.1 hypothetical protein BFV98_07680 [Micromonospora sp. WMMB235]